MLVWRQLLPADAKEPECCELTAGLLSTAVMFLNELAG